MSTEMHATERAYRRGVHQALHLVDRFIHEHLDVDPASVLDIASSVAKDLRFSHDEQRLLMHKLLAKVEEHLGL